MEDLPAKLMVTRSVLTKPMIGGGRGNLYRPGVHFVGDRAGKYRWMSESDARQALKEGWARELDDGES